MAEVASSGADVKENESTTQAKKLTISRVVTSLTSDGRSVPIIMMEKAAELLLKVIDDDAGLYTDCIRIGVEFCGSKISMNKDDYSSFRRLVIDSPIVFIKNPFHQDSLEHYIELTKSTLADEMELGRDITAIHSEDIIRVVRGDPSLTNQKMLKKAMRNKIFNSLLLER
ncbi:Enolase C-terminal domain-like [Parasponia andersonii]|uniref:Enolase C-terminal domain-like n=1 Tax=Parasponia andersonii TaxID=3476 RepID=A0A2P5BA82_PARAD|nr:Enolase C-terminal domain-like [Parasponia andersonii]